MDVIKQLNNAIAYIGTICVARLTQIKSLKSLYVPMINSNDFSVI